MVFRRHVNAHKGICTRACRFWQLFLAVVSIESTSLLLVYGSVASAWIDAFAANRATP
jgi:hypothetical protein